MLRGGRAATCVIAVCLLSPLGAAEPRSAGPLVADIVLDHGRLRGRITDPSGRPIARQEIALRRDRTDIGRLASDAGGWFVTEPLSPGTYEIAVGNVRGRYRVWPVRVAPPTAAEQVLIVLGRKGGRAQAATLVGDRTLLVIVSLIAAVVGTAIIVDRVHDLPTTD